jgi:hypothetical protein
MELSQRDRRLVIILGIVAAVLVVILAVSLLGGGGGQPTTIGPPTGGGLPTTAPSGTPTPTPSATGVKQVNGRDPFSVPAVLCTLGSASPSSAPAPSTSGSPSSSASPSVAPSAGGTNPCATSSTPSSPGGGNNNGGSNGGTGGASSSSTTQGQDNVSLLDVFTRNGKKLAQVRVNGSVYTVEEGESFHQNYELVSISGNCAGFVYGDSPFTLCTTARK